MPFITQTKLAKNQELEQYLVALLYLLSSIEFNVPVTTL